jgi:hypothetical protein
MDSTIRRELKSIAKTIQLLHNYILFDVKRVKKFKIKGKSLLIKKCTIRIYKSIHNLR